MSFQPVLPLSGIAGWRFLTHTEATQRAAFDRSPVVERDIRHFEENVIGIASAEALVADRTLLKVALGAFGLDEEIYKTAFLRRILEEGTDDPGSLASRLVDPRYADFARAFGFGNLTGPRTADAGFAREITEAYRNRQFEIAVGNADGDMRLALGFRREIGAYAESASGDGAGWFRILGSPPLRRVFEAAFNLPREFSGLDIDRQREILRDKTRAMFGEANLSVFREQGNVDRLIDRFLLTQQLSSGPGPGTPGMAALSLLQAGGIGSGGLKNLILSRASGQGAFAGR